MDFYDINDNPIDHLTQWETGRKIKIKGLNSSKTYEAHVFNTRSKTAQVMSTTNSQGTITIEIIDRILQEPYMITVVVHEKTTSASIAVARIEIPVEEAARPEKYVPTDPERPPIAEYVLPIASDITLGGVKGKKKTNETVPVAIDIEGRMYVPTYPTNTGGGGSSTGGGTINEFVFGNLGFDTSKNGIDKGLSQEVYVPYDTVNKIKESDAIKLIFTGGDYLILYKTKKQGPGIKWNCVYTFLEPENGVYNKKIINYSLFAQDSSNSIIWGRDVWDIGTNGTGGSYTLPVANASTLGGVKAKSKTSGDTVEVSADSTGKLYVPTYPAGGGSGGDVEPYVADFTGLTKLADTFAKKESITTNYASLGKDTQNTVDNVLTSKKPIKFIFAGNNIIFNPIRIDANGEKARFVFAEDIPYKKSFFVYSIIIASNPYSVIMNKIRSDDLQSASANSLGGIKADLKGNDYTVPVKIGDDAKLYVPTYPTGGSSTGENHTYIADFTDLTDFDGILKRGGSLKKTCKTFTERQASVLEHIQNNPDDRIVFKFPQNVIIADAAKTRLADDLSDIFRFTWTRWANETTCVFFEMELYYNSPQHQEITFQRQYVNNSTGGTVDTQTVVQEVLKALPTWNGGEY